MALTNFVITLSTSSSICFDEPDAIFPIHTVVYVPLRAVGMGSVVYLMKKDLRTGSSMLRQNLKTIRGWLEEQSSTAARSAPGLSLES